MVVWYGGYGGVMVVMVVVWWLWWWYGGYEGSRATTRRLWWWYGGYGGGMVVMVVMVVVWWLWWWYGGMVVVWWWYGGMVGCEEGLEGWAEDGFHWFYNDFGKVLVVFDGFTMVWARFWWFLLVLQWF